jgi:hypothetical protein
MKTIFGLTLMMLLVACQPNDLRTIYESKQKEIGNEGVLAIHVDERETFAVVIGARDGKTFGKCKWVLRVMEFLPVLVLPVI